MTYYTLEEINNKSAEDIVITYSTFIQERLIGTPLQEITLDTINNILIALRNYHFTKPASVHVFNQFVQEYIKQPDIFTRVPFTVATEDNNMHLTLYTWTKEDKKYIIPINSGQKTVIDVIRSEMENLEDPEAFNRYIEEIKNVASANPMTDEDKKLLYDLFGVDFYTIPNNPPTSTNNESSSRFSGAIWYSEIQQEPIILAGLGGIGSWTALQLTRAGVSTLTMMDPDIVDTTNMSGQFYSGLDAGTPKVQALDVALKRYGNAFNLRYYNLRYGTEWCPTEKIMICGFDNMQARKFFYEQWKSSCIFHTNEYLFIDGRLAAEEFQVYCLTGDNVAAMVEYEHRALFSDEDADNTICSYKQTSFVANMIGSVITNLVVNFIANKVAGAPIRELPYYTYYNGHTMQLITDNI